MQKKNQSQTKKLLNCIPQLFQQNKTPNPKKSLFCPKKVHFNKKVQKVYFIFIVSDLIIQKKNPSQTKKLLKCMPLFLQLLEMATNLSTTIHGTFSP